MIAVLGVDPGVNGGLAVLGPEGEHVHHEGFQPGMSQTALVAAVRLGLSKLDTFGWVRIYVEKVGYMPGDGGKGANTFGRVDGLIRGAILMWIAEHGRGRLYDAPPMMWQAKLGCLTGGNKNVTKLKAQELWPAIKMTHAIADAFLIAEYGRRSFIASDPLRD